ncbi:uncharacterized protein DEA37_0010303 [Paragonimus westermani]|uniref:Fragile site-associated protein C-terminal domain-containing protein n=1 Tax=Paragonimus westermani TaxID=34504 RepID=A0A5J4NQT7_9TREM|nr:uncharacterized protein DEA37_0010303 [Paragonimus westermani]
MLSVFQSELEELALRGLRPEGSQTHGPTEAHLVESKFDVAYLAPDTVDVHLHIPNAQLCFYGALLRHFIHLKENYFGFYQKPVDFAKSPITGDEYLLSMMGPSSFSRGRTQETSAPLAANERVDLKGFKNGEIVDPRDYRPLMVRLSLEFHNVQVHLPMHCSTSTAPCPTAFLDCVGFEMDKRWHETKIQLLFSPILLCTYDHPKPARPKSSSALSTGCIQLMGLCLRGQGMFSHAMLPLDAETLEYAWLLELTVGQLTGQLTAPQLASVIRALNSFTFTMIDAENQLVRSHAFELCQHARPQALCPLRPTVVPKMLCPGESLLKYRFVRVSLDGLDVGIVETGSCLSIQLDPVRLTNCNMHGTTRCNGLFILFPGVRLKQYIRSTIHVNVANVAERPEIPLWRLAFLKRHDLATKRLWFLWSSEAKKNHARFRGAPKMKFMNSTYVAPNITQNCGCFGQCSFFGPNAYGHMLFDELSSGNFQQRAVFPPRSDYKSHLFSLNKTQCVNNQYAPFGLGSAYSTSKDNTPNAAPSAAHFGESLLVEHRLLHELHNPSFCQERHNGLSLMRDETIVAYALSTFSNEVPETCGRCCDDWDLSDHADDSMSSSNTEPSLPGSPMDDAHTRYYREASSSCDHYHHKRQTILTKSASRPSSMSELLVPSDSQDEHDVSSMLGSFSKGPNTPDVAFRRSFFSRLPSDLSLNSLIGPLTPSQPSSRASLGSDNLHTAGESEVHITPVIPTKPTTPLRLHIPPTPPPRQFTMKTTDNRVAPKTMQTEPLEVVTSSDVVIETNLEKVSEKFVDLRGQLNRPITDSGLLRSAYSHHLSVYRCASDWAPTVKLNRRWHLCKSVYSNSELHPTIYNASDTSADQANRVRLTWPYCRMGPAQAPRFELVQPGFSPPHIVSKTDAQPTGCSTEKSTGVGVSDSVGHSTKKRIAARSDVIVWLQNSVDLLLSPLFAESLERYLAVLTPVMINTSPSAVVNQLHIHCVNLQSRKIGHSTQTRSSDIHTYPTSTPNEDPSISSDRLDTSAGLLHQHVFTGSHPLPPTSLDPPTKQSGQKVFAPHAVSVNIVPEASGTLADSVRSPGEPVKLLAEPIMTAASEITHVPQSNIGGPQVLPVSKQTSFDRRLSVPCRGPCESRTGRVIGSGKLAALSVERINVCFLQLYAVEDLVHLDSLRSGLHDLTCVSLLTFCVESVSFEMMSCNETRAILPKLEVPPLTPVESEVSSGGSDPSCQPLLQKFPEESSHDFVNSKRPNDRKWGTQSTSQNTAALAPPKLSHLVSYPSLPEADNPVNNPALSVIALPACRLSHSRQPSAPPALTTSSVPEEHPVLAVSLADCLHHGSASCITDQKLTSHNSSISRTAEINSKEETHRSLSTCAPPIHCNHQPATDGTARGEVFDDQVMIDLANVLSYHDVQGSESVFQLNISRIHGQLRRLTRCSQFSANVLLTAIPFESSRTFFAFVFDKDLQTNLTHPVSASRSVSSWNEQSAGWIMFECGLENLSLSCDYRDGYGDTVSDGKLAANYVKPIHTDHGETFEEEHLSVHEYTSAKLRANKQPSFRKKKMSISLRVSTVWLNFPTPKRLPNKRRVELVRSDWNLLSTAAPSIKAWMDPSERLIQISRRFYAGIERCYLAAITCLMTEAVNYKLPGDGGLFLLHCLGAKDLGGYDRRRTSTARALRFDPSCQLFVVLRRYLFALIEQYGLPETDRMFSDWLKDSIVPPNDLLRCGVLSLTREWRLLVELLAIISQDLHAKTNGHTSSMLPLSVAPVLGINAYPTVSLDDGGDLRIRNVKASRTFGGKTVTPSLLPAVNFAPDPNVLSTSHLLRMASNPVSPIINRILPGLRDCKDLAYRARGSTDLLTTQFMDDHSACIAAFPDNRPLQNENENAVFNSSLVDTYPSSLGEHSDNVMLRRFLQDSKVPVVDSLQACDIPQNHFATVASQNLVDADRNRVDLDPNEFTAPRRASDPMYKLSPVDRHSLSTEADVVKPDRPIFPQSDESKTVERGTNSRLDDRLGVKPSAVTEPILSEANPDAVQSPDVRLTTTDFEQAAHLKAQCQHVAYIQRFFSPLLESVGLSAKGIRRTTLMKKFGGYFSANGLLQKFQIEIVSSVRNPGVSRTTTTTTASGFGHAQHLTTLYPGTNSRPTASANVGIRHCAFLCRNFSSKFTFRDIVDRGGNEGRAGVSPSGQVDIMPTTTNIDVLLNIDFLRQHINLPLLRLLHQFVTMVYCARDAHNSTELRHTVMGKFVSDAGLSHKHGSQESSDLTDATLHSRSSGYVRFGGDSVESCADRRNPVAQIDILSSADVPLTAEIPCDFRSLERVSRSSAEKYSQKVDSFRQPLGQRQPTTSITKPSYPATSYHFLCNTGGNMVSTTDTVTPDCWRRLLNYVDLYTTVPKTRMVLRKPTILGRRLLTTVSYQPLNEDVESGPINPQGTQAEFTSDALGDALQPIGTVSVEHTHKARRSPNLPSSHEVGTPKKVDPIVPILRSGAEPCFSPVVFDQFARPWWCSERVPLAIFVTTKVHQMTMSAVLSEMNLVAGVRNAHGSFTHSTQLRVRGCFTERLSVQSTSLHCTEGQLRLTERLPPHIQLHGVMQRQAKRISSTVSELLRSSPAARTHINPWTVADLTSSSNSRNVTTPTTGSTTTTASDVTAHLKAPKPTQQSNEAHTVLFSNSAEPVVSKRSHTALIFNVLAVSQGLTVNVALHPSLIAIYQISPVYFSGQLGPRGCVEINLTDHSLSLQSVHHPENFPRSIKISLPPILTTILRRESFGGRYSRGQRRQPLLTQGLTAEQGLYWHVQVKVDTLEQTLTTDMLNYIVVVGRLFMKVSCGLVNWVEYHSYRICLKFMKRAQLVPSGV